jgi:arylsulfatase
VEIIMKHLWIALLALLLISARMAQAQERPNIVLILGDNLGYGEIGVYGGGITRGAPTPRIDEIAREGTRLTNFNVEPSCTPSRSAFMVGRHPVRDGTYSVPAQGIGPLMRVPLHLL